MGIISNVLRVASTALLFYICGKSYGLYRDFKKEEDSKK